jgi:hypothetical protein
MGAVTHTVRLIIDFEYSVVGREGFVGMENAWTSRDYTDWRKAKTRNGQVTQKCVFHGRDMCLLVLSVTIDLESLCNGLDILMDV